MGCWCFHQDRFSEIISLHLITPLPTRKSCSLLGLNAFYATGEPKIFGELNGSLKNAAFITSRL